MRFKMYFSLFILLLCSGVTRAANQVDLMDAKKLYGVVVKVEGLGGHTDYCVAVNLKNTTNQTLVIIVNPGILMVPKIPQCKIY